ncbi:MAG: hypothetical protein HYW63_05060 [Candidatus Levybacteria bacterium]|nr:hypothetical protein [Candidatus Levybacteria bacterium]
MYKQKLSIFTASIVIFLSAFVGSANATTIPTFPVCANPQGQITSSYESGVHGVPGDTNTYTGKDTVYSLSDTTSTQCLCTDNGAGIQTNWWKAGSLTQEEIDVLITEGWILIPDGSSWGLLEGPYLAKNSRYECAGSGGTSTSTAGASTTQAILSLASTGNLKFIASIFLTGSALLLSGVALSIKRRG